MSEHNQQFDDFEDWCNNASRWLTCHPNFDHEHFRAHCFDTLGRRCYTGADFMLARDEGAFPVKWLWPDQIGQVSIDGAEKAAASAALYMRYLGVATILGDAMAHVVDDDIEESASAAFMDLAETCPNIKVTQTLSRWNLEVCE